MQQILLNGDMVSTALNDSKKGVLNSHMLQKLFIISTSSVTESRSLEWRLSFLFYSNIVPGFCKSIVNILCSR